MAVVKCLEKQTGNEPVCINFVVKHIISAKAARKAVIIHMVRDQQFGKTLRKSYAKYNEILEMPNMLKIQKDS